MQIMQGSFNKKGMANEWKLMESHGISWNLPSKVSFQSQAFQELDIVDFVTGTSSNGKVMKLHRTKGLRKLLIALQ